MIRFSAEDLIINNMNTFNNVSVDESFQSSDIYSPASYVRTSSPDMISEAADQFNFDSLGSASAAVDHRSYSKNLGQHSSQRAYQSPV
jgi:hypothetical protein